MFEIKALYYLYTTAKNEYRLLQYYTNPLNWNRDRP